MSKGARQSIHLSSPLSMTSDGHMRGRVTIGSMARRPVRSMSFLRPSTADDKRRISTFAYCTPEQKLGEWIAGLSGCQSFRDTGYWPVGSKGRTKDFNVGQRICDFGWSSERDLISDKHPLSADKCAIYTVPSSLPCGHCGQSLKAFLSELEAAPSPNWLGQASLQAFEGMCHTLEAYQSTIRCCLKQEDWVLFGELLAHLGDRHSPITRHVGDAF